MSVEWNHEEIEKLIDAYKMRTELWNPKDNNYHIKNLKNDAWLHVAGSVGCDVTSAKSKMSSLLSSYRKEKAKIKRSTGTGKGKDIHSLLK